MSSLLDISANGSLGEAILWFTGGEEPWEGNCLGGESITAGVDLNREFILTHSRRKHSSFACVAGYMEISRRDDVAGSDIA